MGGLLDLLKKTLDQPIVKAVVNFVAPLVVKAVSTVISTITGSTPNNEGSRSDAGTGSSSGKQPNDGSRRIGGEVKPPPKDIGNQTQPRLAKFASLSGITVVNQADVDKVLKTLRTRPGAVEAALRSTNSLKGAFTLLFGKDVGLSEAILDELVRQVVNEKHTYTYSKPVRQRTRAEIVDAYAEGSGISPNTRFTTKTYEQLDAWYKKYAERNRQKELNKAITDRRKQENATLEQQAKEIRDAYDTKRWEIYAQAWHSELLDGAITDRRKQENALLQAQADDRARRLVYLATLVGPMMPEEQAFWNSSTAEEKARALAHVTQSVISRPNPYVQLPKLFKEMQAAYELAQSTPTATPFGNKVNGIFAGTNIGITEVDNSNNFWARIAMGVQDVIDKGTRISRGILGFAVGAADGSGATDLAKAAFTPASNAKVSYIDPVLGVPVTTTIDELTQRGFQMQLDKLAAIPGNDDFTESSEYEGGLIIGRPVGEVGAFLMAVQGGVSAVKGLASLFKGGLGFTLPSGGVGLAQNVIVMNRAAVGEILAGTTLAGNSIFQLAKHQKDDIKRVDKVAEKFGMDREQRQEFGDYIEDQKEHGNYGSGNERGDFTYQELKKLAEDFLDEYYPDD
jgi:hypothetical protein